jgi:hypothetical protein
MKDAVQMILPTGSANPFSTQGFPAHRQSQGRR